MKIGLVAMSGLRVFDRSLLELGLSFPSVRSRARTIEALPSLGLLTLAAMIPDEHETSYLEVRDVSDVGELADLDVVFLSFLMATATEACSLSNKLRAAGVAVVMGGLHVTLNPDEVSAHASAVVIGEGENVIGSLLEDFENDALKAVYRAQDFPAVDFAELPLPRFELLDGEKYSRFTLQTQRGCPLRCSFCASSIHLTPRYKVKPVWRVIAEVRRLKQLFDNPFIEFADDNTFCDRKHSRQLMKALREENVSWFTESDISIADDPTLLEMIAAAGCRQILIGLEAPSADALNGVELRTNWKAKRANNYGEAIRSIQSHGISVNGCFVLGLDNQDSGCFDEVFEFVESSGLHDVQITYMTPFPGTALYFQLRAEGRLLESHSTDACTLFDITFQPKQMSVEELRTGYRNLMKRLYAPAEVKKRTKRFLAQARGRKQTREQ